MPNRAPHSRPVDPDDTSRCPLGVRCESCGAEGRDLAVVAVTIDPLGVACLTMCPPCAASTVAPPITIATAVRLAAQHAQHLGIDLDGTAAGIEHDRDGEQ